MPDIFRSSEEREVLVNDVAGRRGVAAWVIEKDLWVCWTLARLNEIAGMPQLTFKGGTSLSKVHGLIDRFSEDIDLTLSRDGWGFDGERDPFNSTLTGKKRQRLVDEIEQRSAAVVLEVIVPGLRATCGSAIGSSGWSVDIDGSDSQAVLFTFPNPTATYGYGQPQVKIEFGARGDPWPTSRKTIRPYVEEVHNGTAPTAIVEVSALEAERTFWEKVTLLHGLHHATLSNPARSIHRLSRHIYDVHRMWTVTSLRDRIVQTRKLLRSVVENKIIFFKDNKSKYEQVHGLELNCTPHEALELAMREDFEAMSSMFFPESPVPTFDEMLATLLEIERVVTGWK